MSDRITGPLEDIHGMIAGEGPVSDDLVKRAKPYRFHSDDKSLLIGLLADRIEALEAQLAAREWQPIETAPSYKDLLVCVTHSVGDDRFETVAWVDHFGEDYGWSWFPFLVWVPLPPTHWMPLPEPPKAD